MINEFIISAGVLFLVGERIGNRWPDFLNWRSRRKVRKRLAEPKFEFTPSQIKSCLQNEMYMGELSINSVESGIYYAEYSDGVSMLVRVTPIQPLAPIEPPYGLNAFESRI